DMSKEQFFTHNQVKTELAFRLTGVVKAAQLGRYVGDGMLLTNTAANLSAQPDGAFYSRATRERGRITFREGRDEGFVELEGSPDMVLEVVSTSSVRKDTVTLKGLYWKAGIPEYWLVDVRREPLVFEIFRHTAKGYVATPKKAGWVRSRVFRKWFRL